LSMALATAATGKNGAAVAWLMPEAPYAAFNTVRVRIRKKPVQPERSLTGVSLPT